MRVCRGGFAGHMVDGDEEWQPTVEENRLWNLMCGSYEMCEHNVHNVCVCVCECMLGGSNVLHVRRLR